MSTIYMRIEGVQPDGVGTVDNLADRVGWFTLSDYTYQITRGVSVEVGNATTSDRGILSVSPVHFTRIKDGASPFLETLLHNPGPEGVTLMIARTKPNRDGQGQDVVLLITLYHARLSSYTTSGMDGGDALDVGDIVCTQMRIEDWIEGEGGKLVKHQTVEYDLSKSKLTSKAKA